MPADAGQYRTLRLECLRRYPESFGAYYEEQKDLPQLAFERFILEEHPERVMLGAFSGDVLVGISGFVREEGAKLRHRVKVIQVYVQPEQQGRGIGKGIMQATLQAAFALDGVDQVELGVLAENVGAARVYEKLGFEAFGIQPNYLKHEGKGLDMRMMYISRRRFEGK